MIKTRKLITLLLCAVLMILPLPGPAESPDPADSSVPADTPAATPEPTPSPTPAPTPVPPPQGPLFRVHQINIGCGDAYLLTVGDLVIMVDCGTNTNSPISQRIPNHFIFDYLAAVGIDHVDYCFVTHWHRDHCYNVDILMEYYGSEDSVVYGVSRNLFSELTPLCTGTYRQLKDGDRLTIGPLEILCVGPALQEDLSGCVNIDSMNVIFTYGETRFFFSGDWVDSSVLDRWGDEISGIDFLSFPHHGLEPIYITKKTYARMDPRIIVIPGQERYKVRQFAASALGISTRDLDAVFLSVSDGNILVSSDGSVIWYAANVDPSDLPLGEPLPARKAGP